MNEENEAEARFWAAVDKSGACWLWRGAVTSRGYGTMSIEARTVRVHRFSWELHNGSIPTGMVVCHHCDTPLCVNPWHLFVGTRLDNKRDCVRKGRHYVPPRGVPRPHGGRLTEQQVLTIRAACAAGPRGTAVRLAREYGVTSAAVRAVATRISWRRLP